MNVYYQRHTAGIDTLTTPVFFPKSCDPLVPLNQGTALRVATGSKNFTRFVKGVCLYCHHHPAPLCDKFFIIQLSSCTTPAPSCNCTTFTLFVRHSKPPLSSKNCKTGMTDKPQILRRSPDCRSKFADVSLFPFQADPIH